MRAKPAAGAVDGADLDLIERLIAGDDRAWRQFVTQYQRLVLSRVARTFAQFGVQDSNRAEDVCADVFAKLLADDCRQLRQFEGRSKLSTWLDVVTRRICLRRLAQVQATRARMAEASNLETVSGHAGPDVVLTDDKRALRAAMNQLSSGDQQVLRLFYFDDRSYSQIGEQLGISINTVGPKLQRAQKRLRKLLTSNQKDAET